MNQHEYTYLINIYTDIVGLPVVISTFHSITKQEIDNITNASKILESVLRDVLPKLQDREEK